MLFQCKFISLIKDSNSNNWSVSNLKDSFHVIELLCAVWEGKGGVQDRTIYEDSVFARMLKDSGHISARDYDTYKELFSAMSNFMRRYFNIVKLDISILM